MISHPSVTCQHNIRFLSIVIAIPSHWARNMQQGGSNHHHELFISLSACALALSLSARHPAAKVEANIPNQDTSWSIFYFVLEADPFAFGRLRRTQSAGHQKSMPLDAARRTRLGTGIIFAHSPKFVWTKNVLRERKKKRLLRGLNVAAAHLDSIRRVTAPAHVHEFCKQAAKNP